MGVGGNFWDLLKPYARYEGFDFLRNKKVAVDLSYWIVQHETALKSSYVRNPHLRLTFFRTINLFSKFGAFPVFVVDGAPSPLKSQARILRFFRASGIDVSSLPAAEEGVSVERNRLFLKCVEECQELLKLLGMPVLKAKGEAEALCAQLNSEGIVDACITADSDAFLYGAKFVIKSIRPNSREPLECYDIADIETGLGMKRRHLIAISLLVGNDHNINGVQGIGVETAARFVKIFDEDEVLNRLHEIGTGVTSPPESNCRSSSGTSTSSDVKVSPKSKPPHCSLCGHPGTKAAHLKIACGYCHESNGMNCSKKPAGFKCCCSSCDMDRIEKERKRNQNWHLRVCKKIALECNFLQNQIIEMYLANQIGDRSELCMSWESPNTEMLIDFLAYYQHWEPSFIRQRMFPMLSTIFLREMASSTREILLYGLYELDSIQRVKIRYGHQFYVVKWKKSAVTTSSITYPISSEESATQLEENVQIDQSSGVLDEPDVPQVHVDDGGCFLLTDENVHLVQDAFPEKVGSFLQQKEAKKRKKKSDFTYSETCEESDSQNAKSVQLSIKDYYHSTKVLDQEKPVEDFARNSGIGVSKEKSKISTPSVPKSVRRRLLFQ